MGIYTKSAREVYGDRLPDNVEEDQEIPLEMVFDLEDLNPEEGYHITPMHNFFLKSIELLKMPTPRIGIMLPRSTSNFIFNMLAGSGFGGTYLKLSSREKKDDEKRIISYDRILFQGETIFDSLDTGESSQESLMKKILGKPKGEEIRFELRGMEMKLHLGYDEGEALKNSMVAYDRRSGNKNKLEVKANIPFLNENGNIEKNLKGKTHEEAVNITRSYLTGYLSQYSKD